MNEVEFLGLGSQTVSPRESVAWDLGTRLMSTTQGVGDYTIRLLVENELTCVMEGGAFDFLCQCHAQSIPMNHVSLK